MKKYSTVLIVTVVAFFFNLINGLQNQDLAINGDGASADMSAALDIKSTGKGVLVPRMLSSQRPERPATGLLFYQTDAPAGFYYNTGTPDAPSWELIQNRGSELQIGKVVSDYSMARFSTSDCMNNGTSPVSGSDMTSQEADLHADHEHISITAAGNSQGGTVFAANWQGAPFLKSFGTINGGIGSGEVAAVETIMPVPGIFHGFNIAVTELTSPAVQSLRLTLYVNGSPTLLSCLVTTSGLANKSVSCVDNLHRIAVAEGDRVAIGIAQENTRSVFRFSASMHFQ